MTSRKERDGLIRLRFDIAYDGAPFSGWATQPELLTVQGAIETALQLLFARTVRLTAAGRTDAGVHARGQVAHCDLTRFECESFTTVNGTFESGLLRRIKGTLSRVLGEHAGAILIRDVGIVSPDFDARFSALWRRYSYRIADGPKSWDPLSRNSTWWYPRELDLSVMNELAARLLGLRDFLAFCKPRAEASTIRTLQCCEIRRERDGTLRVLVQADAFCHHMVRSLVAGLVRVGAHEWSAEQLVTRLEKKIRDSSSTLAPAHPLVLEAIAYPAPSEFAQRAMRTRGKRNTLIVES